MTERDAQEAHHARYMADNEPKPGFTPGPWTFSDHHTTIEISSPSRRQKVAIAAVDVGYDEPFNSEQIANIHLIASAPDMREALKSGLIFIDAMLKHAGLDPAQSVEGNKIRAALAKAEGKT